jgi:hypothetical protein
VSEAVEAVCETLRDANVQYRGNMLASAWPSLLGCLSSLLKAEKTVLLQNTVDCLVSLISTASSVGESAAAPQDALVTALVKAAEECEGPRQVLFFFFFFFFLFFLQAVCCLGLLRGARLAQLSAQSWSSVMQLMLKVMKKRPEEELDPFDDTIARLVLSQENRPVKTTDSDTERLIQSIRSLSRDSIQLAEGELNLFIRFFCFFLFFFVFFLFFFVFFSVFFSALIGLSEATLDVSTVLSGSLRVWPVDRLCECLLWNWNRLGQTSWEAALHQVPLFD